MPNWGLIDGATGAAPGDALAQMLAEQAAAEQQRYARAKDTRTFGIQEREAAVKEGDLGLRQNTRQDGLDKQTREAQLFDQVLQSAPAWMRPVLEIKRAAGIQVTPEDVAMSPDQQHTRKVGDQVAAEERKASTDKATKAQDFDYDIKKIDRAAAVRPTKPEKTELTPNEAIRQTRSLRNDFVKETAAARQVQTQYGIMQDALRVALKGGDKNAASQAIITTFNKVLDEGSVVRESEYARSPAGQALLSRLQGAFERISRGGPGMKDEELQSFADMARLFAERQVKAASSSKKQLDAIADAYGLDKDLITREIELDGVDGPTVNANDIQPTSLLGRMKSIFGGTATSRSGAPKEVRYDINGQVIK